MKFVGYKKLKTGEGHVKEINCLTRSRFHLIEKDGKLNLHIDIYPKSNQVRKKRRHQSIYYHPLIDLEIKQLKSIL